MAYYPAHNSILVVKPIGLTSEDIELLDMENNPLHILQYFVSTNEEPAKFNAEIYEDHIGDYEFDKEDLKQDAVMCYRSNDKFLFINLLKNTAWAAPQLGVTREVAGDYVANKSLNGIKSKNKKYWLVIPDKKLVDLVNKRKNAPMENKEEKKKNRGISTKVLDVIIGGAVGKKGDTVTPGVLLAEIQSCGVSDLTVDMIVGACNTLVSHGDLARIPILNSNGNVRLNKKGKAGWASGKYRININTKADRAGIPVAAPIPAPAPAPAPTFSAVVSTPTPHRASPAVAPASGPAWTAFDDIDRPRSAPRIAVEEFIKNNLVGDVLRFSVEDVYQAYPNIERKKIRSALSNAYRTDHLRKFLFHVGSGIYEYRTMKGQVTAIKNEDTALTKSPSVSKIPEGKSVDELAKEFKEFKDSLKELFSSLISN